MSNTTLAAPPAQNNQHLARPSAAFGTRGIIISQYDELVRFAETVSNSGLAPKGMEKPQAVFVAVQMGLEVGLTPMAALQNVAVVNGRPTLWGDAQLAVCRGTGELELFEEWFEVGGVKTTRNPAEYKDDTAAVCKVKRVGGQEVESAFSVADAKRAGLWGKAGPWTQYPFRMLRNRARSFALRDTFGDALKGFRSAEEVRDEEVERDVTPPSAAASNLFKDKQPAALPAPVEKAPASVVERSRSRGVEKFAAWLETQKTASVVERSRSRGVGRQVTTQEAAPVVATAPAESAAGDSSEVESARADEMSGLLDVPATPLLQQVKQKLDSSGLKWSDVLARLQSNGIGGEEFVSLEQADDQLLSDTLTHFAALVKLLKKGGDA